MNKLFKVLRYFLFVFFFVLVLVEIGLRISGYQPGTFSYYQGFQPVDSLEVYDLYTTDSFGIFSFSSFITDSVKRYYDPLDQSISSESFSLELIQHERIQKTILDYFELKLDSLATIFPYSVKEDSLYAELIINYVDYPFNSDGFRSIAFTPYFGPKKKILLLGDSFAYGMSAAPYYNSFADILLSNGYVVYNTGINGTDLAQYAAVAKKYIPLLQPDLVILNFSYASDFMYKYRTPKHNQPHEHCTNAGFLLSDPLGEYLSPQEAYDFYLKITKIPQTSWVNRLLSKTCVTGFLWRGFNNSGYIQYKELEAYNAANETSTETITEVSTLYIEKINTLCSKHNCAFLPVVVPYKNHFESIEDQFGKKTYYHGLLQDIFQGLNYYAPMNFTLEDFEERGEHFNNSGSAKFANYLDSVIIQELH